MLNAVLALNELDTKVFDSPSPGEAPRIYDDHVTVPDAHLLFNGQFQRVGSNDLKIVGEDGQSFFIQDYFASETRAHLMSPQGATLSASVVEALAGPLAPGQHAQAGGQAASTQPVIGRVDALSGSATVVRNGVTVALNVGDTVRKGDVVQTSGSSSVAIVFTDGSTFSLNANARMVLDEFVYAAGGTGNTALISLVQGTFSFVAGQVAKNGDMKVETPVATMGIRGTAVLVEISANDGQTRFSVMVEPDGTTGSFNLYNKTTGALIGTVSNSQVGWVVTPAGPLQVVAQQVQKTPGELAQELGIVQQIFTIFNNNQQNPFVPTQDRGDNPNDTNPQTAQGGGGSGSVLTVNVPITTPDNPTPTNVTVTITPVGNTNTDATPELPTPAVGSPPQTPNVPIVPTLNIINGSGTITGTPGNDQITGSEGDDVADALAGNDFVFAGDGDDIIVAASGGGNDFYDGGTHIHGDTIKFESANGVVFNLNNGTFNLGGENIVKSSTASSVGTGTDVFVRVEKIVGSVGNDVFILHDDGNWEIDARAGIDIVRFANGVDLVDDRNGPEIFNWEIADLKTDTEQNIVYFDVGDFDNTGHEGVILDRAPLRILGGENDIIQITNHEGIEGYWVSAGTFVDPAQDGTESDPFNDHFTDSVTFNIYQFISGEEVVGTVYVEQGAQIALPNEAPAITSASATGTVNAGSNTISQVAAGYLTAGNTLIKNLDEGGGFGENTLAANDDGSVGAISITSIFGEAGLNFFGNQYTSIYINNNGNITFNGPSGTFTPSQIAGGAGNPIIAPFWADVDTRGGVVNPTAGGNSTGSNLVHYDLDAGNGVVTITWDDVGYFGSHTDLLNAFQLQLIDRGNGDFDIVFRYEDINWNIGDASGGLGGLDNPNDPRFNPARAGYSAGDGNSDHYFELSGSGNQDSMLALESTAGNTGIDGVYVFEVRAGEVSNPTSTGTIEFSDADVDDTHTVLAVFNAEESSGGTALGALNVTMTRDTGTGLNGLVTWNYVADSGALSSLPPGTTRTEVYDVVISDGNGGTVTQQVTITVNGPTDAAPVFHIEEATTYENWGYGESPDSTTLYGLTVTDDDAVEGDIFHLTVTADHGTLSPANPLLDNQGPEIPADPQSLTFHATLADINNVLSQGVVYTDPGSNPEDGLDTVTLTVTDADNNSESMNFIFSVFGETGATLVGTAQKDVLFSTAHNDTFTGGAGRDTFVFDEANGSLSGHDEITDFTQGEDRIALYGYYNDYDELVASGAFTYFGENRIDLGGGQSITLQNFNAPLTTLTSADFIFHPSNVV